MNAYIFVAAAVLSVISLLVIFKVNINKLIEDPSQLPKVQRDFLISVGLSKIVPVILLIFGIIKMTTIEINNLLIPLAIIIVVVIYGFIYISSAKKTINKKEDVIFAVNTLVTIARPLTFSIPLMAVVFLLMMTQ